MHLIKQHATLTIKCQVQLAWEKWPKLISYNPLPCISPSSLQLCGLFSFYHQPFINAEILKTVWPNQIDWPFQINIKLKQSNAAQMICQLKVHVRTKTSVFSQLVKSKTVFFCSILLLGKMLFMSCGQFPASNLAQWQAFRSLWLCMYSCLHFIVIKTNKNVSLWV